MIRADEAFFSRPAVDVAHDMIGAVIATKRTGMVRRARIIEVEAYVGPDDLASHSSKGLTKRNAVMFGPPGRAYVYFVYGMHWLFNVVVGHEGGAQAVLVRAGEPMDNWDVDLTGPAKLSRALGINGADNGAHLTATGANPSGEPSDITIDIDRDGEPEIIRSPRVGVDYAQQWRDAPLRFIDAGSSLARVLPKSPVRGPRSRMESLKAKVVYF